jgi:autotransporter-associated beta strand protein
MAKHGHGVRAVADIGAGALIRQAGSSGSANWIGDVNGNGNGDWNNPGDWSGQALPPASATATFATGYFGYTVTGDATIAGILVNGDGVTFDGAITQDSSGGATFLTGENGASVTFDANSFVTGGGIDFQAGSLLEIQGLFITTGGTADQVIVDGLNGQVISSGGLDVNGLYVQDGASYTGDLTLNDGGNLTLDASSLFGGGSLTLLGNAVIYDAAVGGQAGVATISDNIAMGGAGTVLNVGADPGVTLVLSGTLSGAGNLLVSGGTVELAGTIAYTGTTAVQAGTLTIDTLAVTDPTPIVVTDGGLAFALASAGGPAPSGIDTVIAAGDGATVSAGGKQLLVFGGSVGTLTFIGGDYGHGTVVGGSGAVNAFGSLQGGDLIFGGAGQLSFTGGSGSDTVVGGAGVVVATGGSGSDKIYGGTSGHDTLTSGAGNTTLVGNAGTDFVVNGGGNALVVAGSGGLINASAAYGNDTLFAGNAATTIIGGVAGVEQDILGTGNATVYGGRGNADVFAGHGHAQFYFTQGFGGDTDKIIGFTLSQIDINLVNYSAGEAAHALATATVAGGNTYITLSDNTHIDLFGITGVTSANFS